MRSSLNEREFIDFSLSSEVIWRSQRNDGWWLLVDFLITNSVHERCVDSLDERKACVSLCKPFVFSFPLHMTTYFVGHAVSFAKQIFGVNNILSFRGDFQSIVCLFREFSVLTTVFFFFLYQLLTIYFFLIFKFVDRIF